MRICNLAKSVPYKKNPFLGRELLCFANPTQPPEGSGQAEGEKSENAPLVDRLSNVVPGKQGKPEELIERHERWITLLSPYNQIQVQINHLHEVKKMLSDPNLTNTPEYKNRLQAYLAQEYKKMEQVLGVLPNVANSLTDSITRNAKSQFNTDRVGALRDTDRLIAELTKQRKLELAKIGETLKEDLTQRVVGLRKKWAEKPPKGYEDYQAGWLEYCDQLEKTLKAQDLSNLDDGTKDSPVGSKLLKEAEVWWDKLSHMEDSYVDFTKQDTSQFTLENATKVYEELKKKRHTILNDKVLQDFQKVADEVLAKGEQTLGLVEAKIRELGGDPANEKDEDLGKNTEDVKTLKRTSSELKEKLKGLREKKNIDAEVEKVFTSKEKYTEFKVPTASGVVEIPKGIEGQLAALKEVPLSTPGRRQVIRTLLEGMEAVEKNLGGYKEYAEVVLPQALIDMDLFQKGLNIDGKASQREIMLINPFATLGHLWHSYSEAVKGNVETNEKRGAGYFQRDATKIFDHMGKIPVIGNLSVIKSLTELSVNGSVEAEHAEHHRVGEYEKSYEAVPPDHLAHMAEIASDQWELQACLKVLAKAGRIDWNVPWLAKALNKYQKMVRIPEDRHYHMRNLTQSNELMRQAFVYIYRDEDVYRNLRNTNLSSYESKMGDYTKQWGGIAAQPGALESRAEEILALYESDHHEGKHNSKANPIEFESIIRYAVEQGKMKMEARLRLLVRGIASGLLSFDRGVNATDKNNNYPPYDYFDTGHGRGDKPTYDNVLEWNEYAKSPATWDYFMHSQKSFGVMNNKAVNERLIKTMTQGSHRLDHDDAPGIAGYLRMDITRDLLKAKTQGGYGMPVTGLLSLSTGNEMWLRMYAEEYKSMSHQKRKDELVRFASQFMMMEGIMNGRVFKESQDYYRLKEGPDRNEPPRNGRGAYMKSAADTSPGKKLFTIKDPKYKSNASTAEILSYVADQLQHLDFTKPPLVHMLLTNQIKTNEQAVSVCQQLEAQTGMFEGSPPKGIDDLYSKLDKYFEYAISNNTENVDKMVNSICAEHANHVFDHDTEHKLDHGVEHVREAARVRGLTGVEPPHHPPTSGGGGDQGGGHHEGDHPAEGHDHGASHGSTPVGGGPSSHGSTHGH